MILEPSRREWEGVLRQDPCSYCFGSGGTVEHLRLGKKRKGSRRLDTNLVGACSACNQEREHSRNRASALGFFIDKWRLG